jgi:hypothetical protein
MNSMPSGAYSSQQAPMKEKIPSGYDKFSIQNFTPEQMGLFQQMFQHLGPEGYLSKLAAGDQGQFAEMEAPALRQFSGLQGNIASRFSGMGQGARNSSGFQNTMSAASSNFAQELQSNRQNLQRQAIMDLMGMSNSLMNQKPYEQGLTEKPKSFLHEFGVAMAPGIGKGLTSWATGGF